MESIILNKIDLRKKSNKEIVAYGTDGTPLTKEDYKKRLNEAEFDIKEGRVLSSEKLKKQIKNWRKGLK